MIAAVNRESKWQAIYHQRPQTSTHTYNIQSVAAKLKKIQQQQIRINKEFKFKIIKN